jgi:hypothetical protein
VDTHFVQRAEPLGVGDLFHIRSVDETLTDDLHQSMRCSSAFQRAMAAVAH